MEQIAKVSVKPSRAIQSEAKRGREAGLSQSACNIRLYGSYKLPGLVRPRDSEKETERDALGSAHAVYFQSLGTALISSLHQRK